MRATEAPDVYQANIQAGNEGSNVSQALAGDWKWTAVSHIVPTDWRWKLVFERIYAEVKPADLNDLPRFLHKYSGRELAWWEALVMKYGNDLIMELTVNALGTAFRTRPVTANVPPASLTIPLPT